jgi:hypothetical protein
LSAIYWQLAISVRTSNTTRDAAPDRKITARTASRRSAVDDCIGSWHQKFGLN